jgi:hypothetical protein
MASFSPTRAAESLYVDNAARLDEYVAAFPRLDGQSGAVAAVGGRIACLDWVSRSDVWAGLHAKLVRGYALSALEVPAGGSVGPDEVAQLLEDGLRAELVVEGETLAMTVFPAAA